MGNGQDFYRPIEPRKTVALLENPFSLGYIVPPGSPLFYVSGLRGINPKTGRLVEGGVEAEIRKVLSDAETVLSF